MDHRALARVLDMDVERVADAQAEERARHLAVEGPVAEGRALGEPAFDLLGDEVDPYRLWRPLGQRRRQIRRLARDVGIGDGLCRRLRRYHELAFHARLAMAGSGAE